MTQGFDIDELERLLAAAEDSDLTDGGRYFAETCEDLTRCRHGETGEYVDPRNGEALEALWNARNAILTEIRELRAENARLKSEVVSFCGPWAAQYAREIGLEPGHIHPTHYDILEKAGARMANFTRAALGEPQ